MVGTILDGFTAALVIFADGVGPTTLLALLAIDFFIAFNGWMCFADSVPLRDFVR